MENSAGGSEEATIEFRRHCEERSDEAIQRLSARRLDCFAEPVIGRRSAPTRWLAMTQHKLGHDRQTQRHW